MGISQTFDVKLIISDFFHRGEGKDLSSLKQAHFGHEFALFAQNAAASTSISDSQICLIHSYGIPHSVVSNQGTYFVAKEMYLCSLN